VKNQEKQSFKKSNFAHSSAVPNCILFSRMMETIFKIHEKIHFAQTLSSRFYADEKYFQESKEKIFSRSWQLVATVDEINNLKPLFLLENFIDEPILLVKDESNKNSESISCLSNVCTHRGKILVEKECKAKLIKCSYHGRRFDLNGRFLSMPEFDGVENFPSDKDNLAKIPCERLENLVFVSLMPSAPFDHFFGEVKAVFRQLNWKNLKLAGKQDYFVKAHWALYCENYLEGFHIPFVHKSLNKVLSDYSTQTFRFSSLQKAFTKEREASFGFLYDRQYLAALYFFIFPNLMLNFYPWGLSVNIVKPVKPDETKIGYLTFVADESKLSKGAGADLHRIEMEDEAVVESVQKGIRSRFYDCGRYSPSKEQCVHHFHRLIAEFMNT
jgi:choline monooxygenase